MSPAASVKNGSTQVGREPAFLGSPAYLSTTAPHLHMNIRAKLLVSKNAFCHSNLEKICEVQVHIYYKHIYQKEYFLNCILCGKTWPLGSFHFLVSAYLSTTAPHFTHDNWEKFWYLKLLFVIQTWQILVSAPSSCRTGDSISCPPANRTESYA